MAEVLVAEGFKVAVEFMVADGWNVPVMGSGIGEFETGRGFGLRGSISAKKPGLSGG